MLDAMRQAATGWVSKVLLGLLALSFVAWGITGRQAGNTGGQVAQVGDVPISTQSFSRELERQIDGFRQQLQRGISLEQANALGIPERTLDTLIAQAALDDQALDYNLGVSDQGISDAIAKDPSFQVGGRFDRDVFRDALSRRSLTERQYINDLRSQIIRNQLATAIIGEVDPPQLLTETLYKYRAEIRDISYIRIDNTLIDPIGDPDQDVLKSFFEQNKDRYQAPEYRKLGYIALTPDVITDPANITDEQVSENYERRKARDFTSIARRQFHQIRYPSKEEAQAAAGMIADGKSFDDLLAAKNMTLAAADIGLKSKPEIIDADVAEAVFSAKLNDVVPVIEAGLGPAIVRVGKIEPETVTPLSEVADKIRGALAAREAVRRVTELYDEIENERGAGSTLPEAAQTLKLDYTVVDAIAADGSRPAGSPADEFPGQRDVARDAFLSDVEVENNPVRIGNNSYVFYEVLGIEPARPLTLEEAKDDVVADWKREETSTRVGDRATSLFERLKNGESLEDIGVEIGVLVKLRDNLRRNAAPDGLGRNAVAQAFAGPAGHTANAEADIAPDRILIRVDKVSVPDFAADSADAKAVDAQLQRSLQLDLLRAYETKLLASRPASVNQLAFDQITGRVENQGGGQYP